MRLRTAIPQVLVIAGLSAAALGASAQEKAPPLPDSEEAADSSEPPRVARARAEDADSDAPPAPAALKASAPPPAVAVAPAFPHEDAKESAEGSAKKPHRQHFSLGFGLRMGAVDGAGYDPYSRGDALATGTLFGTYSPWPTNWATKPFSLHLAGEWDWGNSDAGARGVDSSLTVHRLSLGLEARYMPITRMRLFVRGMPSAIHVSGVLKDQSFEHELEAASWTWGVDVTGGAAARVGSIGPNDAPIVSFWIGLDMGYRFAGVTSMVLRPTGLTDADATRRFGEIPMTPLDLSGFIARTSFSVAF